MLDRSVSPPSPIHPPSRPACSCTPTMCCSACSPGWNGLSVVIAAAVTAVLRDEWTTVESGLQAAWEIQHTYTKHLSSGCRAGRDGGGWSLRSVELSSPPQARPAWHTTAGRGARPHRSAPLLEAGKVLARRHGHHIQAGHLVIRQQRLEQVLDQLLPLGHLAAGGGGGGAPAAAKQ